MANTTKSPAQQKMLEYVQTRLNAHNAILAQEKINVEIHLKNYAQSKHNINALEQAIDELNWWVFSNDSPLLHVESTPVK